MIRRAIKSDWQRNLAVLWLGELIAISGFSVALPFLPYYVQELGVTGLNAVAFWSALVLSSQAVTMALIAPVWGSLSDRHGRKMMVERAMFGGAVVMSLMGLAQNVYQLTVLRAIQGLLTGTVSAATTLVVSGTPPHRRGYALGMLQMSIYLGSTTGPLLGGLVADTMGYRVTFFITGGLLFLAGILTAIWVHEEFVPPAPKEQTRLWEGVLLVLRTRSLMVLFGIRVLTRMGVQTVGPMLALFIQQISAPGTKVASVTGTIVGLSSMTSALAAAFLGRASDKFGPRRILVICSATAGVLFGMQAWARNTTHLLTLRALAGVSMGGILASVSALQAAMAPKERYGAVYGVDTSMVAAANAVAPMIGAGLTAGFGLPSTFIGAAAMYGAAAILAGVAVPPRSAPAPEPAPEPVPEG
jgi:DHA1 family multidrug resistance protein-like MFS transporter